MAATFTSQEILPLGEDQTPYRLLTKAHVSTFEAAGQTFLRVEPEALTVLTREAMKDIAHLLRPGPQEGRLSVAGGITRRRITHCM